MNWQDTTIGSICDEHGGDVQTGPFGSQLHASDYAEHGIPIVMPQDMQNGSIVCERIARLAPQFLNRHQRHMLEVNDIVFSRRGDVTRFAVVTETESGWICGTGSIRIRLKCPTLDARYMSAYLRQPQIGSWLINHAQGVTMPNLNTGILRALPVRLPPLSEQRRIADVLDRAETLRAKRRAALAELDGLAQSIFIEMFGPPTRIMSNWPTQSLGRFLKFLTSGSRGWAEYYSEMGDLFLRIQNVKRDELSLTEVAYVKPPDTAEANRTKVNSGDVLLSITADIGRTAVVPDTIEKAFISQHLALLRTGGISPRFLSAYLSSESGQEQIFKRNKQGVKAGLNFDDIRSFIVPLPPDTLQQEFARRVAAVEKLKAVQRASLAELDALFASLQDRAFRGAL